MKKCLVFLIIALLACPLFAQNISDKFLNQYNEFLHLNSAYTTIEEPILIKQNIIKHSDKNASPISDNVYCLFHKKGQCVRLKDKQKVQYFFSSEAGYWLYTKKLDSPLKISGAYKVEEFEIQDILKIDFQNEYKVVETKDEKVVLERIKNKSSYKFIFFERQDDISYSLIFADSKQVPIRRIVYKTGVVDGFPCFKQIDIYNLLFQTKGMSSWCTERIKQVNIPSSLFVHSKIKQLTEQMEKVYKEFEK